MNDIAPEIIRLGLFHSCVERIFPRSVSIDFLEMVSEVEQTTWAFFVSVVNGFL